MNNNFKNEHKSILKKILFVLVPLTITGIGTLLYTNVYTISALFLVAGVSVVIEGIIDHNEIKKEEDLTTVSSLALKKLNANPEKYYTKTAKKILSELTKEEPNKPDLKLVEGAPKSPTKDETMKTLVHDLEVYRKIYNLPPLNIEDFEWDSLFENIYNLFVVRNLEYKFHDLIRQYFGMCIAAVLVKKERLNIYSFISELDTLKSDVFTFDDIEKVKNQILDEINSRKIINFPGYVQEK